MPDTDAGKPQDTQATQDTQQTQETEQPQTPPGFIALDKHQKDVNVQHKKFRDEEREHVKARARADKAETELAEMRAEQAQTDIPPPPDPYSATFAEDIATRDDAIRLQAQQDAQIKTAEDDQLREKEAGAARDTEAARERVQIFDKNMLALGLDPIATKSAADKVVEYGVTPTLEAHILEDPEGPLMVTYLAQNPVELEELNGLSAYQLATRINGDIRAKAALLKPQTSNAPDPPDTVTGGGVPEQSESWESGAKYE